MTATREYARDPSAKRPTIVIGIGPGPSSRGGIVMAVRDRWNVERVEAMPASAAAARLPRRVTRLVLDARLAPAVRDDLASHVEAETRTIVEPEGAAPLVEDKMLASWRVQAALALRELLRDGLTLPALRGLGDQCLSIRTVRGAGGLLSVVPAVLPLADAVLLTLAPLLKKVRSTHVWFSGMGEPREFSFRREASLRRLLAGGGLEGSITQIRGGRGMTDGTWDALSGGSSLQPRDGGEDVTPFNRRGDGTGGGSPFDRR